jgi:hypothetical protein
LVIEPRAGFEPFSAEKVHYSYGGANADLLFTVDTIHLGGLKKLYEDEKEQFAGKTIVNIDRHPNNANYGQINVVDGTAASTAELVATLLTDIGIALTQDLATNLLNAVIAATNSFQSPNVTPAAFEVAAKCLRAGGRRFGEVPSAQAAPTDAGIKTIPFQAPTLQPKTQRPLPSTPTPPAPSEGGDRQDQAPADWLKPKIFKSSRVS